MPIDLKQDSLNVIDLTELGVSMQAIEDKIIILVDEYKSGFECRTCKGTGKVSSSIVEGSFRDCENCNGKGEVLIIPDTAKSMPSTGIVMSMGPDTKYMQQKKAIEKFKREHQIFVKMGFEDREDKEEYNISLKHYEEDLKQIPIQIGTRVVFGVHVGTKIPIKGNIKLTIMREREPLCIVFGSTLDDKSILDYSQTENT